MKILGVIPARGGSKGIPRKNLALLAGMSLLEHAVTTANMSRLGGAVCSTDDISIGHAAYKLGARVPFLRPLELSHDKAPSLGVAIHALKECEKLDRITYDAVMLLQPTNPLRTHFDINQAIEMLEAGDCDSVLAVTPVGETHPHRMRMIDDDGYTTKDTSIIANCAVGGEIPGCDSFPDERRQSLVPYYLRDGSIYLSTRAVLDSGRFEGDRCKALVIPRHRSLRIDDPFDLEYGEWLLSRS